MSKISFGAVAAIALGCAYADPNSEGDLKQVLMTDEGLKGRGAVCLDGTDAAFYWRPSPTKADQNNWQIYFEGGGWCYDELDCWGRSATQLGSSKDMPATKGAGGIMSSDCDVNPDFCNFNRVYIAYCDGNSFAGDRADPLVVKGLDGKEKKLYFRGKRIIDAVLSTLNNKYGLKDAEQVLLTGCSAGGLATFLHTDYVHSALKTIAPGMTRYKSIPISGYFLLHSNLAGVPVYPTEMQSIFEMSNATGVNSKCLQALGSDRPWRCNFAEYSHAYTEAPIFPLNSAFDSWQAKCILDSKLNKGFPNQTTTGNGDCGATSFTTNCLNSGGPKCSSADIESMNGYIKSFEQDRAAHSVHSKKGNGFFAHTCYTHCEAQGGDYQKFAIGGVTIQQAVSKWWNSDMESAETHTYTPCQFNEDPQHHQCNPTCGGTSVSDEEVLVV